MNRFSKVSLAALGGVTVLMLAVPADAAVGRSKFHASVNELRRFCERIDEPFWRLKRNYGCGDEIVCSGGSCVREYSPPRRQPPPLYSLRRGDGGNGGGGSTRGGNEGGGGGGTSSGRGSAGGPN
ncbi:MAG: hypothetical protein AB7F09_00470 [Parvibaculaceae bacterium]